MGRKISEIGGYYMAGPLAIVSHNSTTIFQEWWDGSLAMAWIPRLFISKSTDSLVPRLLV